MQIFGPYRIEILPSGTTENAGNGDRIFLSGSEHFQMGTSPTEETFLIILVMAGRVHADLVGPAAEAVGGGLKKNQQKKATLDCQQAEIHLVPAAPPAASPPQSGRSGLALTPKRPSFSGGPVKKVFALHSVRLCYGNSAVMCNSLDWNLPDDLLIAEGASGDEKEEGLAVVEMNEVIKVSGRKILLRPEKEDVTIIKPLAIFGSTASSSGTDKKKKSTGGGP